PASGYAPRTIQFSPDGRLMVAAGNGGADAWSLPSRRPIGPLIRSELGGLIPALLDENRLLLATPTGGIRLWELAPTPARTSLPSRADHGMRVCFSRDG